MGFYLAGGRGHVIDNSHSVRPNGVSNIEEGHDVIGGEEMEGQTVKLKTIGKAPSRR